MTESVNTPKRHSEQMCEIAFEWFEVKAYFSQSQPPLASYSIGYSNAIVVDIGHSLTQVATIKDCVIAKDEESKEGKFKAFEYFGGADITCHLDE